VISIRRWLSDEPPFKRLIITVPKAVFASLVLSMLGAVLVKVLFPASDPEANGKAIAEAAKHMGRSELLVLTVVVGPLIEELLFRLLPFGALFILAWLTGTRSHRWLVPVTMALIVQTAAMFGYMHGTANILVQGMAGLILGSVFVKYSGFGRNVAKGFTASVVCHAVFNAAIFGILMALGGT
jgi:membrane protease YdiL (CAAX protease family)